ncbi:MAG: hypothetical protein H6721_24745 [Sandaracinus sp.]|nr:hypothetical protein [Sandaracinus sp.]MCB9613482.1 hypothetical protein [Sandaracinus sp.]MCB9623608.1 hypothetical protein [Sandaracinus sp.]MCB9635341.1 hypothetical protein [Sandaracinus sp.]
MRTLLEYLEKHGSVGETELIGLLGSSREQRKLNRQLDELGLPVQVEVVVGVKLYRLKR